ncbi:MAG: glycosyltransferase family 39 protein [candidate division Zixibacteria bacterium]|nr:glycosyltransferase family 39 protein [candidate division Zixibacteria bacterium]
MDVRAGGRWLFHTQWGRLTGLMVWTASILFFRLGDLAFDPDEALIRTWAVEVHDNAPTWTALGQRIVQERGYYLEHYYPGLNIYLTAGAFRGFGVSAFTARLPSVLIALLCIPLFYLTVQRLFRNPTVTLVATILLTTSAPLLFLMRQCRYTSLTVLAGLWLVWAYLDLMDRKRSGLWHGAGASILFIYTSFYLYLPLALSLGGHSLLFARGTARRNMALLIAAGTIMVLAVIPAKKFSIAHLVDQYDRLMSGNQIAILHKMSVCLDEINLFGLPFLLIPIYLHTRRGERIPPSTLWTATGFFAAFALLTSTIGAFLLHDGVGSVLDRLWPSLSPRIFNRIVDYRSYVLLVVVAASALSFYHLRASPQKFQIGLPIAVMAGMIALYCIIPIYRMPWTRYLANPLVVSFILGGVLIAGIGERHRLFAAGLSAVHISSNLLSLLPFSPNDYPLWQWKLPHWVYRMATGDLIPEIILNFVQVPPR